MSVYNIVLVLVGVAILGVAWLPSLLEKYPLSYPILFIGLGMAAYTLPLGLPPADPFEHPKLVTHLSELCVIIALTGTGLKIDRPFSLAIWRTPLKLVLVLMLLTIAGITLAGWTLAGLPLSSAVLLAACLAPTDPVLASDVQVGDPGEGREDNVRFALTGEAGLNDGLAFPFVYLALALLPAALPLADRMIHWLWLDLLYRVAAGVVLGWLSGLLLSYLIFNLPKKLSLKPSAYGFVALAVTLTSYGVTELLHGYGFLAVFVAAVTLRGRERKHEYHKQMHAFTDQMERLLIVIILIMLGGAIVDSLLAPLTWSGAMVGLLLLLVLRPLGGLLTLLGAKRVNLAERGVISFFGIRGIGSIFYLAYALDKAEFPQARLLWAILGFTVLVSVVLHGVLATPVMNWLDRRHGRKIAAELSENEPVKVAAE
ncbi:sodium/hydrogen exchanger [Hymenobacter roseosalivarius DSM 11622]|uniref:Sodium/hydrogen exchanger n=1 Tax=Hymenobacter roseosalivarius DSM 11622 TaxID=645990 RepID=A0A1W1VMG8_9BACT|nr:cation:proton antiporter [Hymenobacter roseosalivarius]SMB94518.1 sodium/hydrogen exchanger [Hymenobacter roseosalivarius DSM 11622]